jgi:hypothetical protein
MLKKARNLSKKKETKESLVCELDWTWTTIYIYKKKENRVKKYEWTIIYLFFTICNAKNLTCISNNQKM